MANYKDDRAFTDSVHKNLALPIIYKALDWQKVELKNDYANYIDMVKGIDYVFKKNGEIYTVQERFRTQDYKAFSDFTIRYRRDYNSFEDRKASEYYKMKAHYFTYGIINTSKNEVKKASRFLKFAVIDLQKVYEKLDSKAIFISDNHKNTCCITSDNRLECPIKYNADKSSSFFPIDISYLVQLWGSEMVVLQQGFL